jgi:hypothetical protein
MKIKCNYCESTDSSNKHCPQCAKTNRLLTELDERKTWGALYLEKTDQLVRAEIMIKKLREISADEVRGKIVSSTAVERIAKVLEKYDERN